MYVFCNLKMQKKANAKMYERFLRHCTLVQILLHTAPEGDKSKYWLLARVLSLSISAKDNS